MFTECIYQLWDTKYKEIYLLHAYKDTRILYLIYTPRIHISLYLTVLHVFQGYMYPYTWLCSLCITRIHVSLYLTMYSMYYKDTCILIFDLYTLWIHVSLYFTMYSMYYKDTCILILDYVLHVLQGYMYPYIWLGHIHKGTCILIFDYAIHPKVHVSLYLAMYTMYTKIHVSLYLTAWIQGHLYSYIMCPCIILTLIL